MKPILFSAVLLVLTPLGFCDECDLKKVDDFIDCIGKKMEDDMPRWTPDLIKEKEAAMSKCFVSNGCKEPDYDRDVFSDLPPNFQTLARKMKSDWENTNPGVKKCIFSDMKGEILDKLNQCLTKQSVPTVKELPDGLMKHLSEKLSGGGDEKVKKLFEMIFTAKTNVARALRVCHEDKGDAVKKVWDCFQGVRQKYMYEKMCTDKHTCEKDKLDDTCVKRGEEINTACCKCNDDKRDEFLKKIEDMRKNPDADMDTVAAMFCEGHNVTELMAKTKKCYESNKVDIPASFRLLKAMHDAKDSGNAPKLQFNKATIDTIEDIVMGIMDEDKCYICKAGSESASNSTMV